MINFLTWLVIILPQILGISTNLSTTEIISFTNLAREERQLNPLHPNDLLNRAAEAKAQAMLESNTWSHDTPTATPWEFLDVSGYSYLIAGENLAKNYRSAEEVVNAWLKSPSHRDNLLNPEYTETGVAVVEGEFEGKSKSIIIVQFLARPYQGEPNSSPHVFPTEMISQTNPLYFMIITLIGSVTIAAAIIYFNLKNNSHRHNPVSKLWRR